MDSVAWRQGEEVVEGVFADWAQGTRLFVDTLLVEDVATGEVDIVLCAVDLDRLAQQQEPRMFVEGFPLLADETDDFLCDVHLLGVGFLDLFVEFEVVVDELGLLLFHLLNVGLHGFVAGVALLVIGQGGGFGGLFADGVEDAEDEVLDGGLGLLFEDSIFEDVQFLVFGVA